MESLNEDLVNFNIAPFLRLQDKQNLSLVNKIYHRFYKKTKYYHIGTIIGNNLGLETNNNTDVLSIMRDHPQDFIKYISEFLFDYNCLRQKFKIDKYFTKICLPMGILHKIFILNKKDCLNKLKNDEIRLNFKISFQKYCRLKDHSRSRCCRDSFSSLPDHDTDSI